MNQKPSYTCIPYDQFTKVFKNTTTEISSAALTGKIISFSDDFFASVHNLLKVGPSDSLKGQFGEKGALYDGWESRRHNQDHDWAIVKLGPELSTIMGFDIDTANFNGNEGPEASVWGLRVDIGDEGMKIRKDDVRWELLLPPVPLGPDAHHLFKIEQSGKPYSHVKLCMIPDGGIARFRVYGTALPPPSTNPPSRIDLAYALNGGILVATSNQHYGIASNLLLPGRGFDMGDGWETRRSRVKGHCEWVVVKLGAAGWLDHAEIDTAFHMGNPPMFAELHAINCEDNIPPKDADWTCILSKKATGPHRQHFFPVENARGKVFTHVRLTIYPDGGLKRLRIMGYRADNVATLPQSHQPITIPELEALPLTYEAFRPYGQVAQGFSVSTAAPKGLRKTEVNQGTACKYHKMIDINDRYPVGTETKTTISVVRADPQIQTGKTIDVRVLERHRYSGQTFIPMGKAPTSGQEALDDGGSYVAIVALSGADDKPDLSTLRAFLVTSSQGVSYAPGVWHHPLLTAESTLDYACIETSPSQTGYIESEFVGPTESPLARVIIPEYSGKTASTSRLELPIKPKTGSNLLNGLNGLLKGNDKPHSIPCQLLTAEAFGKFGQVVQAYGKQIPKGIQVDVDEKFKLRKFMDLAPVTQSYPEGSGATTAVSVFRCTVKEGMERGKQWPVHFLERHPYTEQTFIPMGTATWKGKGEEPLQSGAAYVIIVAENGEDDRPDPRTLQAFLCSASQGVNYTQGVWHHPMLSVGGTIDFACVETQTGEDGEEMDCQLLEFEEAIGTVDIPAL